MYTYSKLKDNPIFLNKKEQCSFFKGLLRQHCKDSEDSSEVVKYKKLMTPKYYFKKCTMICIIKIEYGVFVIKVKKMNEIILSLFFFFYSFKIYDRGPFI